MHEIKTNTELAEKLAPKTVVQQLREATPERRKEIDRELSKALIRIMAAKALTAIALSLIARVISKKLDQ